MADGPISSRTSLAATGVTDAPDIRFGVDNLQGATPASNQMSLPELSKAIGNVINKDTVAEMLALTGVPDGTRVDTARYSTSHTVGDGSGGEYVYDADSTATVDDVKILPGIGGEIGGSDGTGRWIHLGGWVSSSASGATSVNLTWDNEISLTGNSTLLFLGDAGKLRLTSNRATVLDGTTDYWKRAGSPVSAYPFSYSCFAKLDADAAANGTVMSLSSSVSGVIYMAIRFDTNGGVTLLRRGAVTTTTTIPAAQTPGTEHHVAVVWSSATAVEVFIDGVSIYSTPLTSMAFPAVNQFLIGLLRTASIDGFFDGTIRDVRVFNVAIDSAEITKIRNRQATANSPVGWWRLDIDGTDYGSLPVNATATGSPTFSSGATITWPTNTVWHGRASTTVYDWYGDLFDVAVIGGVPHVTPLRSNPEIVYASDYGIKAGGSFATEINALFAANQTATITFPPGVIDIASQIDLSNFSGRIIAPNTIWNWTGGAAAMVTSSGANWIIDGLRLDGNDVATIGFQLEGSSGSGNASIPRLTITNCTTAIDCGGVGTNVNAADLNFGKLDVRDCTNGLKVNHSQGVNYIVQAAYFWNVDNGFLFDAGGGLHCEYAHCVNIGNVLSITGDASGIGTQNGHYAIMGGKVDGQQTTTPTIVHTDTSGQCRVNVSNFRVDGLQKEDGRFLFDLTSSGQVSVYVRDSGIFDVGSSATDIASLNADTGKTVKLVLDDCQYVNTSNFNLSNNISVTGEGARFEITGGENAATLQAVDSAAIYWPSGSDDGANINALLAAGRSVQLQPSKWGDSSTYYNITTPITADVDGASLTCPRGIAVFTANCAGSVAVTFDGSTTRRWAKIENIVVTGVADGGFKIEDYITSEFSNLRVWSLQGSDYGFDLGSGFGNQYDKLSVETNNYASNYADFYVHGSFNANTCNSWYTANFTPSASYYRSPANMLVTAGIGNTWNGLCLQGGSIGLHVYSTGNWCNSNVVNGAYFENNLKPVLIAADIVANWSQGWQFNAPYLGGPGAATDAAHFDTQFEVGNSSHCSLHSPFFEGNAPSNGARLVIGRNSTGLELINPISFTGATTRLTDQIKLQTLAGVRTSAVQSSDGFYALETDQAGGWRRQVMKQAGGAATNRMSTWYYDSANAIQLGTLTPALHDPVYDYGNVAGAVTLLANGGIRQKTMTLTGDVTFTIPNGSDRFEHEVIIAQDTTGGHGVTWGGNLTWSAGEVQPVSVAAKNVTSVDDATDTFSLASHAYSDGTRVRFTTTGTLPTGVAASTTYFIVNATSGTFQVSTSDGGSAVDITSTGTGTLTVHPHTRYGFTWNGVTFTATAD